MIGKTYWAIFKFYDNSQQKMAFKKRPVLIIGEADKSDYIVLPISRVTQKQNLDLHYDFELQPLDYPLLSLKAISYVRTHKQTVLNKGELGNCIADFGSEYQDSYISVIALVEEFQNNLINKAF